MHSLSLSLLFSVNLFSPLIHLPGGDVDIVDYGAPDLGEYEPAMREHIIKNESGKTSSSETVSDDGTFITNVAVGPGASTSDDTRPSTAGGKTLTETNKIDFDSSDDTIVVDGLVVSNNKNNADGDDAEKLPFGDGKVRLGKLLASMDGISRSSIESYRRGSVMSSSGL